jgi:hypothetical protein
VRIQFDQNSTFLAVYAEDGDISYVVPVIGFEVESARPMVPSPESGALVPAIGIDGFTCLVPVVVMAAGVDATLEYVEKYAGVRLKREGSGITLARPLPN